MLAGSGHVGPCEHGCVCVSAQAISYPDWDFNSTCYLFTECLSEIQAWSEVILHSHCTA